MTACCLRPPLQFLYDLVFEKEDPTYTGAARTHRNTRNRTMLSYDRNFGEAMVRAAAWAACCNCCGEPQLRGCHGAAGFLGV